MGAEFSGTLYIYSNFYIYFIIIIMVVFFYSYTCLLYYIIHSYEDHFQALLYCSIVTSTLRIFISIEIRSRLTEQSKLLISYLVYSFHFRFNFRLPNHLAIKTDLNNLSNKSFRFICHYS